MFFNKKSDKDLQEENYEQYKALVDIFKHSLSQGNINVVKEIRLFLTQKNESFRNSLNQDQDVVYPSAYYSAVYEIAQHIVELNNTNVKAKSWGIDAPGTLLGDYERPEISTTTFNVIWSILKMFVENNESQLLINFWGTAHQYFSYQLKRIDEERDEEFKVINEKPIKTRDRAREAFLEFLVALGGLVTYREKYGLIRRFFSYTQSQPPKYDLLPDTMDEVFGYYFSFRDPYEHRLLDLEFPFPEMDGLMSSGRISLWVTRYIAILFLRQYTLSGYMTHYIPPVALPKIPETQGDKSFWLDHIDHFQKQVTWALKQKDALSEIGLDFINQEWCKEKNMAYPIDFFEELKEKLKESFRVNEYNQRISEVKRKKFIQYSSDQISELFESLTVCFNKEVIKSEFVNYFKGGAKSISPKSSFADNQGSDHINFHSFLASAFINDYRDFIAQVYLLASIESYKILLDDIPKTIKRLDINSKEHIIINFNTSLDNSPMFGEPIRVKKDIYQGFDMITLKAGFRLVERSLFFLRKEDLPSISYHQLEKKDIERLELDNLNTNFNLYASLIDLNLNEDVRKESIGKKSDDELKKSVLASIIVNHEVRFKSNAKVIRIQAYSPYEESGMLQKVTEIKKFDDHE
ncbi:hypothetical protein [uncultured Roseivirga sp.]|mgnify:CR=1 FL=1|uniref:hypothetical protein n=1 Tax=uncultured Roseivirga sp. TaxID=543088 RepID=UPI000D7A3889|nr:hypothetical protein [uncultured Roseivirga sp.]PWL30742.1 MAG: hypothetical protein DCO95_04495 [Roseivirga sp. XM-24bin3]